ncbi:protein tincar [Ixodes scapularis]|uniref:protein tincar n=1 Tax=Ixodes scapularis TaxID=6945 RepID=UPI001A9EB10F|nr:protein tincar [Ixodes scapularis]
MMSSGARRGFSVCREPRLNSLCCVWYCTAALALSIYIVAGSVQRFTRYMALPWPPRDQPYLELNAYVGCIGAAVVLLPFFVASAMLQVGNLANDGGRLLWPLGVHGGPDAVYENLPDRRRQRSRWRSWLKALWRHGGPTAPTLHVWSAFCLLLPRMLVQGRLIRHGFLRKSDAWRTDLDLLLPHRERLVVLSFLSTINETELWDREASEVARPLPHLDEAATSAEFLNYGLALLVYSLRYPAVFWKSNKCFALLFSLYLGLCMAQRLLIYTGLAVLYKVQVAGVREVLPGFGPLFLGLPSTLFLYALYSTALSLSGPVLYSYGLLKFQEWKARAAMKNHITWKGAFPRGLWGHGPHLYAFFVLSVLVLSGGPLLYDLTKVYCGSLDGAVLAVVAGILAHLLLWIALWLGLTLKHDWDFSPEGPQGDVRQLQGVAYTPLLKTTGEVPLLVIDQGHTYQVREASSKKAIISLATKFAQVSKLPHPSEDEDIYWLKPRLPSAAKEPSSSQNGTCERSTWLRGQRKTSGPKHKVTFEEKGCSPSKKSGKSPKILSKLRKQHVSGVKFEDVLSDPHSDDGGDYATLREVSTLRRGSRKGDEEPFYKSLCPLGDTSALLPEADYELLLVDVATTQVRATVHGGPTSPSTTLTPRSDCVSDTSTSPEKGASSESSGVHSACSESIKRASSLEQLVEPLKGSSTPWKSLSLQRNMAPPELVIRRDADPFGRKTNVRLTSFTDQPDFVRHKAAAGLLHAHRRDSANYSLTSSGDSDAAAS